MTKVLDTKNFVAYHDQNVQKTFVFLLLVATRIHFKKCHNGHNPNLVG